MMVTKSLERVPPLFTVAEIAKLLKVSTKSVRRWIEAGDLIAHRLGRQLRITESDLSTFIKQCRDA
jgi:excisionase family DNA binding protein